MLKHFVIALALGATFITPAVADEPDEFFLGDYGSEGCGEGIYCSIQVTANPPSGYTITYSVTDAADNVLCRDYGDLVRISNLRLHGFFSRHQDRIALTKNGGSIDIEWTTDRPCNNTFPVNGRYWVIGN